jgi:hypothetical protein
VSGRSAARADKLRNLRKLDCVAQRSDAPLRSAIKPSQIASIYLRCCALHRIRDT